MLIVNFFLDVRGDFIFGADKEGFIEEGTEIEIGGKMSKAITVYFFIILDAALDKQQQLIMIGGPWRGVVIAINEHIL